jgi:hypothetical protein
MTEISYICQEFDASLQIIESQVKKMGTVAAILIILLTMPVSYAMLDVASRKIKIRNRMEL